MNKEKIAISVDKPLLEMIDDMIDGTNMRSRSQAIETLLKKGIEQEYVKAAVILIKDTEQATLLKKVKEKSLMACHLEMLYKAGIKKVYLITKSTEKTEEIVAAVKDEKLKLEIIDEKETIGSAQALLKAKPFLKTNFVVMLGDTYNNFDLKKMILYHLKKDKIATVGLISHNKPILYSSVQLEGDNIVEFRNKKESNSYIIDAGIYIFKPLIFKYFDFTTRSLERDVLPVVCQKREMDGYFTYGEYIHLGEETINSSN